ncbi:helix-turn-helix domain-containing protein [Variovorax sp. J22P271]|uniref:GlxA family transcriptional regulator n=1 Tax=Variovorax davisae TaxID=3053515 RepID=UPI002574A902|nr:helix-turn-helix domain-containing protein [Variovorax sp. J22P271]MDM0033445.1 helix-turn-helix domain-containing protein [Variovorax sp. J22P271]
MAAALRRFAVRLRRMDKHPVDPPVCLDLLLPADALHGAVYCAIDTCRAINSIARSRSGRLFDGAVAWRLFGEHLQPHSGQDGVHRSADELRWSIAEPLSRATFVPPLEMVTLPQLAASVQANARTVAHLRDAAAQGHFICAVGTGVWLVAAAGLLEGRRAPVQWSYQSGFARSYPQVAIANEEFVRAADRILLAATPSSVHECVIELTAIMGLGDVAHAAREKLLFDPARQFAASMMPLEKVSGITRDSPLFRAVQWIAAHAELPVSIKDAAAHAAVSERTLARLFQQHLGVSPHDFLTDIRMKRAQMWLEVTLRSVEEIAHDCGYADVSAFRRVFKGKFGLTPIEHRTRYTTRAPRARWKLERFGDDA